MGSNPVAPTIIQNRWLSRQYELESQRFFSCLDVSFPLLFVNLKKSFEHFCITLCNYVTLFSHIIHKMGCKCGFLRILYTIINAEI